jgi:hypothetical protein
MKIKFVTGDNVTRASLDAKGETVKSYAVHMSNGGEGGLSFTTADAAVAEKFPPGSTLEVDTDGVQPAPPPPPPKPAE